jgi:GntR family transcriptional regulator
VIQIAGHALQELHMDVMFQITPSSGAPIYRQIMEQVERLVLSGHLQPGDELPSVRHAAGALAVNPMTISKAYSLLEAKGVLERVRGKGMIVADCRRQGADLLERLDALRPALENVATQARQLDLPRSSVLELLANMLEETNE